MYKYIMPNENMKANKYKSHKKDETLPSGAIIHWSESFEVAKKGGCKAWATCGKCGNKRFVWVRCSKKWTGNCRKCNGPKFGKEHPLFKGEKIIRNGYVFLLISCLKKEDADVANKMRGKTQSYIAEHRLVMARHIGRPLKCTEVVHHLNEVKTDNRIQNLYLTNRKNHGQEHVFILKAARSEVAKLQKILDSHNIPY